MRELFVRLLLFSAVCAAFGDLSSDVDAVKQFFSSQTSKITPSNAKSCDDASADLTNKCTQNVIDCGSLQSFLNCAWDVAYKDCGNDKAKQMCSAYNSQYGALGTTLGCNAHCSASSILISGSIGALLLYKMVLEKFFFNL